MYRVQERQPHGVGRKAPVLAVAVITVARDLCAPPDSDFGGAAAHVERRPDDDGLGLRRPTFPFTSTTTTRGASTTPITTIITTAINTVAATTAAAEPQQVVEQASRGGRGHDRSYSDH